MIPIEMTGNSACRSRISKRCDTPAGFHNYFNAYGAPGSSLPPGNDDGIQGALGFVTGTTNFTNGLDRMFDPDSFGGFLHGAADVFGGAFQIVGCGVGGLLQMGSSWLNSEVDGIPVLSNIVQPIGDLINGAGAVLGDAFNGLGEGFNDLGNAAEDLCNGNFGDAAKDVGNAVVDAGKGVADAVGDAASSVVDSIGDLF
jgi:hypothetical protein